MTTSQKSIAIINGTGRQAASVIRAVSALGWAVKAQIYEPHPVVKEELEDIETVELFQEPLENNLDLIDRLFEGCQYAFINTFPIGDEVKLGKDLANAAKKHRIQHYIYCSMPDHSVHDPQWPGLPNWACKFTVEQYIRQLGVPSTFLYAGIYNNNFTSLPYPLFCMDFKDDESVEWRAPFDPNTKLPWLDAETDTGPAVLQLFKDGIQRWKDRSLRRLRTRPLPPVHYAHDPHIAIRVPIPTSYREQLAGIETLFGQYNAPYFPGPDFEYPDNDSTRRGSARAERERPVDGERRASGRGSGSQVRPRKLTSEARRLWPGFRRIEDYAREAFPIEEEANGKTWMRDKMVST